MLLTILENEKSLQDYKQEITEIYTVLRDIFKAGGRLYLCGNGGSFADSIHIAGELMKSFEKERPLSDDEKRSFKGLYGGDSLAVHIERGLPACVLGANTSLSTALLNDSDEKDLLFAQEVHVLGREGDVLIGISTSGNARNVLLAVSAAKARGMKTIGLTGKDGGMLKDAVDVAVVVHKETTREVQQVHQVIYHTLCLMLEEYFFGTD